MDLFFVMLTIFKSILIVGHESVHFEMIHEITLAHVAHAAEVTGVRAVVLMRDHVVHQGGLLTEPPRTEVARPWAHRRVLILRINN